MYYELVNRTLRVVQNEQKKGKNFFMVFCVVVGLLLVIGYSLLFLSLPSSIFLSIRTKFAVSPPTIHDWILETTEFWTIDSSNPTNTIFVFISIWMNLIGFILDFIRNCKFIADMNSGRPSAERLFDNWCWEKFSSCVEWHGFDDMKRVQLLTKPFTHSHCTSSCVSLSILSSCPVSVYLLVSSWSSQLHLTWTFL